MKGVARFLWSLRSHFVIGVALVLVIVLASQKRELREEYDGYREEVQWPFVGYPVPALPDTTLAGDTVVIGAPVASRSSSQLIFVFNTRCAYCKQTIPAWNDLATSAEDTEVDVIGVSMHGPEETARYKITEELEFPVVTREDERFKLLYRATGVPLTLIINREGTVTFMHKGVFSATDSIMGSIRTYLSEEQS